MSVQGINVNAPTSLLIRGSPYWSARVAEHILLLKTTATAMQRQASPPIILDEMSRGLNFTAYEFIVYVGLLQAEEHMLRALSMGLPPPTPLHGPLFQSFAPAGLPTPSIQTLNNVSQMAAFFGREDLALQVPIAHRPTSQLPQLGYGRASSMALQRQQEEQQAQERERLRALQEEREQREQRLLRAESEQQERRRLRDLRDDAIYAETARRLLEEIQARVQGPVNYIGNEAGTLPNDHYFDSRAVLERPQPQVAVPVAPSATETVAVESSMASESEAALLSLPDGRIVLPPMLSPLSSSFYESAPASRPRHDHPHCRPPLPTLEPPAFLSPPSVELGPWSSSQPQPFSVSGGCTSAGLPSIPMAPLPPPSVMSPRFQVPRPSASQSGVDSAQIVQVGRIIGSSDSENGRRDGSSHFPQRFQSGRAAERRHHPYLRNSTRLHTSSRGTQIMTMEHVTATDTDLQQPADGHRGSEERRREAEH